MRKRDRDGFSRREVLGMAAALPLSLKAVAPLFQGRPVARALDRQMLVDAPASAVRLDGSRADNVEIIREWNGPLCRARIVNRGANSVRLKEIVLFDLTLALPAETALYGEGFQMLSQTGGTLGQPVYYSQYTDTQHYKIPAQGRSFYGVMTLTPPDQGSMVLAFTSCARFAGRFELDGTGLRVVMDFEGGELAPDETLPLEEFMFARGLEHSPSRLLADVASRVTEHHWPLKFAAPPAGWCSWYCFGPRVTAQQVLDNLDVIAKTIPSLKYIQIDDGYQPAMGDWLETGAAFGGNVKNVLAEIRARGFEPAIWVAPFIAEENSHLFQQHRDWFVKDDAGQPLRADRVTFGGWRHGPWYALDGTHSDAQAHLEQVFRTMRQEWGCTYFKLDANFWGAMHGGRFHDPRATRIEAYRRGMAAVRRGSGDAFLLGCNHPIWPSIGEIHGSRSSNDIKRTWDRIQTTARQNLSRNWQNGKFWWNDPDAVCLSDLADDELMFHATAIYAAGGLILSGDDLTRLPPGRVDLLRKLLPPTGVAATFQDDAMHVGEIRLPGKRMICVFNWDEGVPTHHFGFRKTERVFDFWTGEPLRGTSDPMTGQLQVSFQLRPRTARLLEVRNV